MLWQLFGVGKVVVVSDGGHRDLTMIIETRYRDIPFEEAKRCVNPEMLTRYSGRKWERARGRPIRIIAPAITEKQWKYIACEGPFYSLYPDTFSDDGVKACVCPHIAEIGD